MRKGIRLLRNLCLFLFMGSLLYGTGKNMLLKRGFTGKDPAVYDPFAIRSGEADLKTVTTYFAAADGLIGFDWDADIRVPVTIHYYAGLEDRDPAFTIEKGETIRVMKPKLWRDGFTCRGIESLPTEKRGLRLAKPFQTAGREVPDKFYYVKLNELRKVVFSWMRSQTNIMKSMRQDLLRMKILPTQKNAADMLLLSADRVLIEKGVFMSRDLMMPPVSAFTVVSGTMSMILSVLFRHKSRNAASHELEKPLHKKGFCGKI